MTQTWSLYYIPKVIGELAKLFHHLMTQDWNFESTSSVPYFTTFDFMTIQRVLWVANFSKHAEHLSDAV